MPELAFCCINLHLMQASPFLVLPIWSGTARRTQDLLLQNGVRARCGRQLFAYETGPGTETLESMPEMRQAQDEV